MNTLECSKCKQQKPDDEFAPDVRYKNRRGRVSWCKDCKRAGAREYKKRTGYRSDPEYMKQYYVEHRSADVKPAKYFHIVDGHKVCPACGENKPVSEYPKNASKPGGIGSQCKPCHTARVNKNYKDDPGRHRGYILQGKYGITIEQYNEMHAAQGGVCAICSKPETVVVKGKRKSLAVDHDHSTGKVRKLLCAKCNTRLHADAEANWHQMAADYLAAH